MVKIYQSIKLPSRKLLAVQGDGIGHRPTDILLAIDVDSAIGVLTSNNASTDSLDSDWGLKQIHINLGD
jgi:hypothetical protein